MDLVHTHPYARIEIARLFCYLISFAAYLQEQQPHDGAARLLGLLCTKEGLRFLSFLLTSEHDALQRECLGALLLVQRLPRNDGTASAQSILSMIGTEMEERMEELARRGDRMAETLLCPRHREESESI
jgi:hypothetical protein